MVIIHARGDVQRIVVDRDRDVGCEGGRGAPFWLRFFEIVAPLCRAPHGVIEHAIDFRRCMRKFDAHRFDRRTRLILNRRLREWIAMHAGDGRSVIHPWIDGRIGLGRSLRDDACDRKCDRRDAPLCPRPRHEWLQANGSQRRRAIAKLDKLLGRFSPPKRHRPTTAHRPRSIR